MLSSALRRMVPHNYWLLQQPRLLFCSKPPPKAPKRFNMPDFNEMSPGKKYFVWGLSALISAAVLINQVKRLKGEEISIEKMLTMIEKAQTDSLTVKRTADAEYVRANKRAEEDSENAQQSQFQTSKAKMNDRKREKGSIKIIAQVVVYGETYYAHVIDIQSFLARFQQIQQSKMYKTKLFIEECKSIEVTLHQVASLMAKVLSPILLPLFLFRSQTGKTLRSKIMGKTDGVRPNIFFKDVAGLGNAKIQISELVDFLKNPKKYKEIGARIPKGALLAGPPGTGKTMMAKACAGEANVPFFSVSGSEFVELFGGMGASRVRELFTNARAETPSIIFIDQIDAIGRKRDDKFGGGNDERANTLNQLLVEMDGFGTSEDIIVLAATNRKQMLDSALTRPGRFDRIVEMELPDIQGRMEILEIYLNKLKLSPNTTMKDFAKRLSTLTFGFSGADLANLCNQAAILAVRRNKTHVQLKQFEDASDRVLAGLQQSMAMDEKEKKKVAYHECGHAVVAWFLQGASPLLKITIVPRSKGSLGFAQYLPNQSMLMTKEQLIDQMCVILGGRAAEDHFFKEVSNGAADDLSKVLRLARAIIVTYGMGTKNPNYAPVDTDGENVYSQNTASQIDWQIMALIDECTERTKQLVALHADKLEAMAQRVIEKETLVHTEIKEILGERPFEIKENYRQFLRTAEAV